MCPVVAPLGTIAVMLVAETTVKVVAGEPLNATSVAPVNPDPLIVTLVPTGVLVGVKELTTGGTVTVKLSVLVAVLKAFVTLIGPEVALLGTVAVICVSESKVKLAALPLNLTDLAPVKLAPVIATVVPTGPLVGENEVI